MPSDQKERSHERVVGNFYTLKETGIHGGTPFSGAPKDKYGRVFVFRMHAYGKHANPDAPDILDWGSPDGREVMANQNPNGTPLYIGYEPNQWQYAGLFKVKRVAYDRPTIQRRARRAGKSVVCSLFMERV
jgi:hypothetical protein